MKMHKELQQKSRDELLNLVHQLQKKTCLLQQKNFQQQQSIDQLTEQLNLNRHKRFAKQSERDAESGQLSLFDEAEPPVNQPEIEVADEQITVAPFYSLKPGKH